LANVDSDSLETKVLYIIVYIIFQTLNPPCVEREKNREKEREWERRGKEERGKGRKRVEKRGMEMYREEERGWEKIRAVGGKRERKIDVEIWREKVGEEEDGGGRKRMETGFECRRVWIRKEEWGTEGKKKRGKEYCEWENISTKKTQFTVKILGGTCDVKSVLRGKQSLCATLVKTIPSRERERYQIAGIIIP
jgi:hypothetical protein